MFPSWPLPLRSADLTRFQADRGTSAVEYGLLIAGIAALIAMAAYTLGGGVAGLFTETCDEVTSAAGAVSC